MQHIAQIIGGVGIAIFIGGTFLFIRWQENKRRRGELYYDLNGREWRLYRTKYEPPTGEG